MKVKPKKKKGLARLFEIAGQRKGLLILAGRQAVPYVCLCLIGLFMKS